jgi:tetratricopeptide (TPR) repeat protein
MPRIRLFPRHCLLAVFFCFCAAGLSSAAPAKSNEPKWARISSAHFAVLTDADDKKNREIVLRLEQMRDVFSQLFRKAKLRLPEPLEAIAFKSDEEYIRVAPLRQGQPTSAPGFFLAGDDRNYIVLDLAAEDSWRAVSHDFARLLLNFNYPPTQDWFDEGFAQYFSSLRLGDDKAQIGGDPAQNLPWEHVLPGEPSTAANAPKSFVELLNRQWLPMPELFMMRKSASGYPPMFYAQSWIVMHYLLNQNKLSEAGAYFGLVEIQKIPVDQAIQQAFGVSAAQFEQAVKSYFQALAWPRAPENKVINAESTTGSVYQFPVPVAAGQVGSSVKDVSESEAQSLIAEMSLRMPEHREQGEKELQTLINDPKTENAIAHRGLAWAHMERKEFDQATQELARGSELDAHDLWTHYYLALVKFRAAQSSREPIQGVSNMVQDLLAVLDLSPDFAEAYNMLAMARLQGGGVHAARDAIRVAIQLSPRNEQYLLNSAQIELAGKQWDDATALLNRLKGSLNPQIAQAAQKSLNDLPTLKKYGVLPQENPSAQPAAASSVPAKAAPATSASGSEDETTSDQTAVPAEPQIDKRKVQYLRGKLLRVDCSQAPAAVLTVRTASRTMKLRTENYKSLLLVGADEFSCEWTDRPVVVNYKAGGKSDGDLVTVEVQ